MSSIVTRECGNGVCEMSDGREETMEFGCALSRGGRVGEKRILAKCGSDRL